MKQGSGYIIGFAVIICLVCSVFVAGAAVSLKERQEANKILDRREKVLVVAGLKQEDEKLPRKEVEDRFASSIETRAVELATGQFTDAVDVAAYDQRKALSDPSLSVAAPANPAGVRRLPKYALVYLVKGDGPDKPWTKLILPVEGKGLWSTLYGFVALDRDLVTIQGLTFYEHAETPGLGGEVDNPRWKSLWPGRKAFGADQSVKISVIKGSAGPPETDPHRVDGLSGATITGRGVEHLLRFWLGEHGFGPFVKGLSGKGAS